MMLSIAIMHAPWSGRKIDQLIEQLPTASIVEAEEGRGVRHTAERAWRARPPGATHHLVVQDDAILCKNFLKHASAALLARPYVPISFFTSVKTEKPLRAWFTSPAHLSGLAVSLPVQFIDPWLRWWPEETLHDDGAMWRWLYEQGIEISLTNPSLVQHAELPSLLNHSHRSAPNFDPDPGDINWQVP